jgi:hypothetical protein
VCLPLIRPTTIESVSDLVNVLGLDPEIAARLAVRAGIDPGTDHLSGLSA